MARALQTVLQSLVKKLPTGFALGRRGGVLDTLLVSIAVLLQDTEASGEHLMDEVDPRKATVLLGDFERVLGPDPCGRDLAALTVEQRQRLAHQRWTASGGQSISYMLSVAAKLGVAIEIEEFWPSKANVLRAGDRLVREGEQFTWRVRMASSEKLIFKAGNRAGERLVTYALSGVECVLMRIKPAHTLLVFTYYIEEP